MRLTPEQENAIQLFGTQDGLAIHALAGTGKTTTLAELARATPKRRGIYLAFNDSIASEAERTFPSNVNSRTTHAHAIQHLLKKGFDHQRLIASPNINHIKPLLPLDRYAVPGGSSPNGWQSITRDHFCSLVQQTLSKFCQSADSEITYEHIPQIRSISYHGKGQAEDAKRVIMEMHGQTIRSIWQRMNKPSDLFPVGHDAYLKMWTLDKPALEAEFIMLDEAQDTNDAVLSLLKAQQCQVVYVGDSFQQIYEWRGAVDALKKVRCTHTATLTGSFRFGQQIADVANGALQALGSDLTLRGLSVAKSAIVKSGPTCKAILFKRNASMIHRVISLMETGYSPAISGGVTEWLSYCDAFDKLEANTHTTHPELFGFDSIDHYKQHLSDYPELAGVTGQMFTLREKFGASKMRGLLGGLQEAAQPDVVLSTVYKAKGLQWSSVELDEDLSGGDAELSPLHRRLQYVAVTRAMQTLMIPWM